MDQDRAARGAPAVELSGIDKRFGPVHANRSIDLRVPAGTIHGIVGENGAGKSTLMNILYGFYQADGGPSGSTDRTPDPQPRGCDRGRHRHGPSALHAGRAVHRAREPAARRRGRRDARRRRRPRARRDRSTRARVRSRRRPRRDGRRPAGRRAAAGRDPQGAVPRRARPDPRRADRRADPAGGRPSVPHPAQPARPGPHRGADHPQAARDHGGDRQRLGDASGRHGRAAPDGRDLDRGARRADGRPQGAAQGREGRRTTGRAGARGRAPGGQGRQRRHAASRA